MVDVIPRSGSLQGSIQQAGTIWFVSHMLTGDLPGGQEGLREYLQGVEDDTDAFLRISERLSHLDLDDEKDAEKALESSTS